MSFLGDAGRWAPSSGAAARRGGSLPIDAPGPEDSFAVRASGAARPPQASERRAHQERPFDRQPAGAPGARRAPAASERKDRGAWRSDHHLHLLPGHLVEDSPDGLDPEETSQQPPGDPSPPIGRRWRPRCPRTCGPPAGSPGRIRSTESASPPPIRRGSGRPGRGVPGAGRQRSGGEAVCPRCDSADHGGGSGPAGEQGIVGESRGRITVWTDSRRRWGPRERESGSSAHAPDPGPPGPGARAEAQQEVLGRPAARGADSPRSWAR